MPHTLPFFTHGLMGKWTYLARTVPGTSDQFKPLEETIRHRFIPALTGRSAISDIERNLLSLPTRLGGLGIMNPSEATDSQYVTSQQVTAPPISLIIQTNQRLSLFDYGRATSSHDQGQIGSTTTAIQEGNNSLSPTATGHPACYGYCQREGCI